MKLLKIYSSSGKMNSLVSYCRTGVGIAGPPVMSSNLYFADGILIDTGISNARGKIIEFIYDKKPLKILLTHHHEDHSGNADIISRHFNIKIYGQKYTVNKMRNGYKICPYQHLMWGKTRPCKINIHKDIYETPNLKLRPVHTPGHSKDHTVFHEINHGWLFSGDLYLGDRIKYFRKDENLKIQIHSLKKIMNYDFDSLFCAHRPILSKGKYHLGLKLDYLENLYGEILHLFNKGYSKKYIGNYLRPKGDRFIKWFTLRNVSFANIVSSALENKDTN